MFSLYVIGLTLLVIFTIAKVKSSILPYVSPIICIVSIAIIMTPSKVSGTDAIELIGGQLSSVHIDVADFGFV